jgi:hypothetical protein
MFCIPQFFRIRWLPCHAPLDHAATWPEVVVFMNRLGHQGSHCTCTGYPCWRLRKHIIFTVSLCLALQPYFLSSFPNMCSVTFSASLLFCTEDEASAFLRNSRTLQPDDTGYVSDDSTHFRASWLWRAFTAMTTKGECDILHLQGRQVNY